MAERVSAPPPPPPPPIRPPAPPSDPNPTLLGVCDPVSSQSPPVFESGTYIVQVPKDQIYRIPPPENARFIELHQNPKQNKRRSNCCSCCVFISVVSLISIVLIVGLSLAFSRSKNPDVHVQHFVIKNFSSHNKFHHGYDLKLKIHNPKIKSAISYKNGGAASLFFKERKLADGKLQMFHQDDDSIEVVIVLKGSNKSLPENIRHSIKNAIVKLQLSFSLKPKVQAKLKIISFNRGDKKLIITCNFMADTLSSAGTRILAQKCHTNHTNR